MKENMSIHKRRSVPVIAASILTLAVASLLVLLPFTRSLAQQEPNRQLVQPGSTKANAGKRMALVIGNGAYTSAPPLKNPPNDARDMAATLRALGFDVTNGINVSQRDMKRLIREFGQKLRAGGSGLFFYAGHGVQSSGRNYLIPVDADIQSEAEVEDSSVDVNLVLKYMDEAQNGLNVVILDACRNNPFARSFRSASDGLAQVDAPTGTLIAYATAPGRVASDGTGQNGLYTSELLKQMHVPGLSVTDMFMRVRAEVMKQTANKQVPWEASSLVGSFYFSGVPGESNAAANITKIDPTAFELSYWETIKNSQSAEDFKAYLAKYPEGEFASLAKIRLDGLQAADKTAERSPAATAGQAELSFWDSIKNSTNAADFRAYLEKYPNGEFAALAKNRLGPLEARELSMTPGSSKSYKSSWGLKMSGASTFYKGTLNVYPSKVVIEFGDMTFKAKVVFVFDGDKIFKGGQPMPFECSMFTSAVLDKSTIREIPMSDNKFRLNFNSSTEAADAFASIQEACKKQ